ncbi:MAG: adenylyltransferase/cytidyltransferase family protein [Candidatus Woesearchaeota archaeon]
MKKNLKKVLVFGTFDGLHKGHIYFLREAAKRGALYVVVAKDKNVLRFKRKKPVHNEKFRLNAVSKLPFVKEVMLGKDKDIYFWVRKIKPDTICLGYDQNPLKIKEKIKRLGLSTKIIRLKPYRPNVYKSSIILKTVQQKISSRRKQNRGYVLE